MEQFNILFQGVIRPSNPIPVLFLHFQVTNHGLKDDNLIDRQFMIVDAHIGKFVTARQFPKIVLIRFDVDQKSVTFSGPDVESLRVELPAENKTQKLETQVIKQSRYY